MFEKSLNIMNSSFKNTYSVSLDFSLWIKFLEFLIKFVPYNCKIFLGGANFYFTCGPTAQNISHFKF